MYSPYFYVFDKEVEEIVSHKIRSKSPLYIYLNLKFEERSFIDYTNQTHIVSHNFYMNKLSPIIVLSTSTTSAHYGALLNLTWVTSIITSEITSNVIFKMVAT